jgi:hypothetical protein
MTLYIILYYYYFFMRSITMSLPLPQSMHALCMHAYNLRYLQLCATSYNISNNNIIIIVPAPLFTCIIVVI